mmetsp:Transcript_11023/g.24129  ORF Transcript_11023/g.24129 Transcript_11023/m.24129 type:complete len:218 (+) Transcript_11023:467-1120(+)
MGLNAPKIAMRPFRLGLAGSFPFFILSLSCLLMGGALGSRPRPCTEPRRPPGLAPPLARPGRAKAKRRGLPGAEPSSGASSEGPPRLCAASSSAASFSAFSAASWASSAAFASSKRPNSSKSASGLIPRRRLDREARLASRSRHACVKAAKYGLDSATLFICMGSGTSSLKMGLPSSSKRYFVWGHVDDHCSTTLGSSVAGASISPVFAALTFLKLF